MMKYCHMTFQKVMSQFPNLVLLTRRDTSTLHSGLQSNINRPFRLTSTCFSVVLRRQTTSSSTSQYAYDISIQGKLVNTTGLWRL